MKERLIGAAVLVALAVWLIPWVLNGPQPIGEVESETLELPAAQSSTTVRTQTIRLDESRDPPTPAPRNETPATPLPPPAPEPSARTVEPDPAPPEPPVQPEPLEEPEPPVVTGAEPPVVTPAEPPVDSGEAWMVQIGSFREEDNARRLADRVATFGFTARVSTFAASGRPMYRVRVGPESTRERAAAVASSLSAHGFVAQVVSQD